jgi:hypothetical protein
VVAVVEGSEATPSHSTSPVAVRGGGRRKRLLLPLVEKVCVGGAVDESEGSKGMGNSTTETNPESGCPVFGGEGEGGCRVGGGSPRAMVESRPRPVGDYWVEVEVVEVKGEGRSCS